MADSDGNLKRLAAGTSGYFLKTNGPGADPAWVALSTSVAWGAITGALSSQTDLQTELNAKANTASLGTASTHAATDFATSAQGAKADTAVQPGSLATVATTGAYNDLSGKPTLGTAAYANVGSSSGELVALDVSGHVPSALLPSYVDDVVEVANYASLPATGETSKLYVTLDTSKIYRWSGSVYAEVSPSPGSTDSVTEGSTNLYFTAARAIASALTGFSVAGSRTAVTASDTILAAFGKVQKYLDDLGALAYKAQASLTADVTGTLPVANGGTNATTAAAARTSLGVPEYDATLHQVKIPGVSSGDTFLNATDGAPGSSIFSVTRLAGSIIKFATFAGYSFLLDAATKVNGALEVGTVVELGHASDTTLSRSAAGVLAVEGVVIPTVASTSTITNKRNQPRTSSSTSTATLTPDLSTANVYYLTAQTTALTVAAPIGTPVIGEVIAFYVYTAAAQTLTMNATYKPYGAAFPATTTAGKKLQGIAQYNGTDWDTVINVQI